jgi:hypothetical protein
MAKPVAGSVRIPLDTGNTGKYMRTQSRVIGADTVHEHYFVQSSPHERLGSFFASTAQLSVQAAAHTLPAGFCWLLNPVGSAIDIILRQWSLEYGSSAVTAAPTAPVITLARMTFTGTASGASVTPAQADSTEAAAVGTLRTASTGLTISAGAAVASSSIPAILTGVGIFGLKDWLIEEARDIESNDVRLAPGHGVVLYQSVAGTASDPRRFTCDIKWDEVNRT